MRNILGTPLIGLLLSGFVRAGVAEDGLAIERRFAELHDVLAQYYLGFFY